MNEKYACGICGKEFTDLDEYMKHVNSCGIQLKKKREEESKKNKRLLEVNAAINRVKQAKIYYEQKLAEFKEKYPEEYELNFAMEDLVKVSTKNLDSISKSKAKDDSVDKPNFIELSYKNNGKDKPEMSAKIDGEKLNDEVLREVFEDPELRYLGKLLGII